MRDIVLPYLLSSLLAFGCLHLPTDQAFPRPKVPQVMNVPYQGTGATIRCDGPQPEHVPQHIGPEVPSFA